MKGTNYNFLWTEKFYSVLLGKQFFKGNEFTQRLGTHQENDPFGGEKGFLRVILWLCLILCCSRALCMCSVC